MTKYACYDCDATFDAPTDTESSRCPGCGEMVEQQPVASAVVSPPPSRAAEVRPEQCPTLRTLADQKEISTP
ncbi:hypothetical protein [Streptomyces griseofuscus]|uniref:hypothetical protein n=1 Tax=Streptomyces griseofuscus TaxID=146922 RepID=UPI0033C3625D